MKTFFCCFFWFGLCYVSCGLPPQIKNPGYAYVLRFACLQQKLEAKMLLMRAAIWHVNIQRNFFMSYTKQAITLAEIVLQRFLKVSSIKSLNGKLVRLTFKTMRWKISSLQNYSNQCSFSCGPHAACLRRFWGQRVVSRWISSEILQETKSIWQFSFVSFGHHLKF